MIGFFVLFTETERRRMNKIFPADSARVVDSFEVDNIYAERSTLPKFLNDKCFHHDGMYVVILEGFLLNSEKLKREYAAENMFDLCVKMYETEGDRFFNKFRGSFSGFFYDLKANKFLAFTDHGGENALFYATVKDEVVISTDMSAIVEHFRRSKHRYHLSVAGAYSLLTYAFMFDDYTLVKEIKRLRPGHYLSIERGRKESNRYFDFYKEEKEIVSLEEAIEEVDRLFVNALTMQLEKNKEYGYANYASLSAGMDTRVVNYVMRELTDDPIYNITYSQTGQHDHTIPAKIAADLKNHWLFSNLDNGLAMMDVERATEISDGMFYYAWPAMISNFMESADTKNMGIIHTGVNGNDVLSSNVKSMLMQREYQLGDGAYSKKLIGKLRNHLEREHLHPDRDVGEYIETGLGGVSLAYATSYAYYAPEFSPFSDPDLIRFCFRVPLEDRVAHHLYYKWVASKYAAATKYPHNSAPIPKPNSFEIQWKGKRVALSRFPAMFFNSIRAKRDPKFHMNPFEYWYQINPQLKQYMDDYRRDNMGVLHIEELARDADKLYDGGTVIEKMQVLSLLAAVKKLF